MATPDISFRIGADLAEIRTALSELRGDFQRVGAEAKKSLADTGTDKVGSEIRALGGQLKGFAASIGVALGVRELIALADTYSNITGRLKLVTKATGDFDQVQKALVKSANETRAPLEATVDLYTKIAPSLAAIGFNSQRTVGVITTVNQAIALSGSSAEASSAALVQFAQGLGSGTLRGDEFNSVMEQTPGLADAIARGLGKTRGQLREMANDGQLTATVIASALEKVRDSIATDFASLPITTEQAMTQAANSLLLFVGRLDQATGITASLARAIAQISGGIDDLSGSAESLRPVVEFLQDMVDGAARFFRVIATGIAGYTLAIQQATSGDLKGALATYQEIGRRVAAILDEPLAAEKNRARESQQVGLSRLQLETDFATKTANLEKLRAVAAGTANADILKSETELQAARTKAAQDGLKARLKGEEDLSEALRKEFEKSLVSAQKARDDATALREKGKDARGNANDKAADRRNRDLTDQQRSDLAERDVGTLTARATLAAGDAQVAARDGDLKRATKLAEEAARLADKAEKSADKILNNDTAASALEDVGRVQEKVLNAQASIKDREAADLEQSAEQQNKLLQDTEARISALKTEIAKPVTIQTDIAAAEAELKQLKAQLDEIKDKEVTVTVKTVQQGAGPAAPAALPNPTGSPQVAQIPGLATGGKLAGPGTDTSDNLLVWGSPDEWVIRAAASRYYGDDFMHRLNTMQIPRFATGGKIGAAVDSVSARAEAKQSDMQAAVFNFPDLGAIPVRIERKNAERLGKQLRREALATGKR